MLPFIADWPSTHMVKHCKTGLFPKLFLCLPEGISPEAASSSPRLAPGTAFHCRPRSLSDFWLLSSRLVESPMDWGMVAKIDDFWFLEKNMAFPAHELWSQSFLGTVYGHSMTSPYFKTHISRHFRNSEHTHGNVASTRIATWQKTPECEERFQRIHQRDLNLKQDTLPWYVYEVFCVRVLSSVCLYD